MRLRPCMAWWSYSEYADSKEDTRREIARRQKRGEAFVAVEAPKGNKLATSFWGLAWQRHLEGYADYESRLPRGRTYLRQGNVFNLEITAGSVHATVAGQSLYEVRIGIRELQPAHWSELKHACAGQVASVLDLLGGRVGDGVMKVLTDRDDGLFPSPNEITLNCSCPDWAGLCKHCAAVLYAVGLRFDKEPELFFKLRGVDHSELVDQAAAALATQPAGSDAAVIEDAALADVFGIELAGSLPPEAEAALAAPAPKPSKKRAPKKKAVKKTARRKS